MCYQVLVEWKQRQASQATYRVLADALEKCGRTDLKEVVNKKANDQ